MSYRLQMLVIFAGMVKFALTHGIPVQSESLTTHRPYQFAFNIPGNQHRQEMKDTNGIITGDFGFVTGDGAYHKASYATDEFGRYRLISARSSYRYNPNAPKNWLKKTTEAPSNRGAKALGSSAESLNERHLNSLHSTDKPALVHLVHTEPIHEHMTKNTEEQFNNEPTKKNQNSGEHKSTETREPQQASRETQKVTSNENNNRPSSQKPKHMNSLETESNQLNKNELSKVDLTSNHNTKLSSSETLSTSTFKPATNTQQTSTSRNAHASPALPDPQHSKPIPTSSPTLPTTPKTLTIPKSGNYFIHIPPNVVTTLGVTGDLLYVFNYATTFHGHNERGYRSGAKEGAYFTVNRDKVRRTVRYKLSSTNEVIRRVMEYDAVADHETPNELSDKTGVLERNEFKWH